MQSFIDNLRRFNRKERFYLLGFALDRPSFTLGRPFRSKLLAAFGLHVPTDAFVAMDYHLTWLYASLYLEDQSGDGPFPAAAGVERGNQQDIDLLIAYETEEVTHVLLLEAKGLMDWDKETMEHKAERLSQIFGETGNHYCGVIPHFAIHSPFKPSGLTTPKWPTWMTDNDHQPAWIPMRLPEDLQKVTRCDENCRKKYDGGYWKIEHVKKASRAS
jgi:hypothetical protein